MVVPLPDKAIYPWTNNNVSLLPFGGYDPKIGETKLLFIWPKTKKKEITPRQPSMVNRRDRPTLNSKRHLKKVVYDVVSDVVSYDVKTLERR